MRVEREVGADCAPARASGVGAPGGPARRGLFARVSLLPFLVACGSGDAPPTASEPLPEGVDTAVRGMRTFVTRDGVRRAVVEADTAEWREDNVIHLRRMTLTFFDPGGLESTEVTAEFGVFHQLTGDLEAERRVVVEDRVDNQRLETERLRYRNADGRLLGDTTFQFVDPVEGLTLDGTAFESDPALDSVVVLNQEGEMLPVASFTEAIPLPAVPAGDPAGVADEPTAEEPTAEEPAAEEPAAGEPTAGEPAAGEPAAEEQTAGEPVADEPAAGEPVADEPAADEPAADEPAADEPLTDEPAPGEPAGDPAAADPPAADSAAVEVDPEAVPAPDSAAAADSVPAPGDSVAAAADSVPAPGDSVAAPPDTTETLPDSLSVEPDTREALPDILPAPADSAAALPDSPEALPDTTAAALPDSLEAPPDTTAARR